MTSDVEPATRYADVCFLTDLRFPGGNASSTLDEVATLRAAGLRVLLMHCPSWMHRGKPVSTRYDGLAELCLTDPAGTERVVADTVLVRHPLVVCADDFPAVAGRITARKAAFIVNNAMRRAGGDEAYDLRRYLERFEAFDATHRLIFPIGPLVREELAAALPSRLLGQLAPFDWTPTFDLSQLRFQPRASLRPPYRIGRHGRDSAEKWLQQPEQLTQAYPTSTDYSVRILGGDDGALAVLGERPRNWCVHPFGSLPTPRYLADLDVFVYCPHTELREAFGRAIVEAMVAGVPCVLRKLARFTTCQRLSPTWPSSANRRRWTAWCAAWPSTTRFAWPSCAMRTRPARAPSRRMRC